MGAAALRILTAGSVDDGKSTLIGRLLYDSRAILADQLEALEKHGAARPRAAGEPTFAAGEPTFAAGEPTFAEGEPSFDLSLLTDGLEAEREQGITIDVAYRYFATKTRKFIIADAPGHEQYTRNMVTAAAGSDAAVVLVDITKIDWRARPVQLLPQTRRHALLAQLLRVPSIVFAVNKLDAVADAQHAFGAVREALASFASAAGIAPAGIVPVSALRGDNVTRPLDAAWYRGPSLLGLLENLPNADHDAARKGSLVLPVQYVAREANNVGEQARTFWGRIAQGQVIPGDEVQVTPSGERARVAAVRRAGRAVEAASSGQSAGLVLDRQLDISRGDWIATPDTLASTSSFVATLAWLDTEPAVVGRKYWLRHGNRWVQGRLTAIEERLDIHTLLGEAAAQLAVNDIGVVRFDVQQPLPLAPYAVNRVAGALIVVDPTSHRTSGALLVAAKAQP